MEFPGRLLFRSLPLVLVLGACSDQGFTPNPDPLVEAQEQDPDVVVPDGTGVGSLTVQLCALDDSNMAMDGILVFVDHTWGRIERRTNAEGLVSMATVPEGVWTLQAQRGGQMYIGEVQIFADEHTHVEIDDCLDEQPTIVLAHTSSTLYKVHTTTGQTTALGTFRLGNRTVTDISDLAVEGDSGQAFAVGMSGMLYEIDAADASLTEVCGVPPSANALAWSGHGKLMVGALGSLWMVDPVSCAQDRILESGTYSSDGDIAPAGVAEVFWAVSGGKVMRVDLQTGATSQTYAHNLRVYGLSVVDGELLGFTPSGGVWTLGAQAGSENRLFDTNHAWWGAAAGPVAE